MPQTKMHFGLPRAAGNLPLTALLLFFALPARPAPSSPSKSNPDSIPKELKLSWRSLSPSAAILAGAAEWNGRSLRYESVRTPSVEPLKTDKRSVVPTPDAWQAFAKSLDEIKVWDWVGPYPTRPSSERGFVWHLAIKWGAREVKSSGTNCFPSLEDVAKPSSSAVLFHRFWDAVDRLAAEPIEVEGSYFAGFETSRFTPFTHGFRGDMWWLETNDEFTRRYEKFRPQDQAGTRVGGAEVLTRLRGHLVGPGAYGHLNQFPYLFIAEQVLEMKPKK